MYGTISVSAGETIYIFAGGEGADQADSGTTAVPAAYNGVTR